METSSITVIARRLSIDHRRVVIELELEQIVRRVLEKKGLVLLGFSFEAREWAAEEGDLPLGEGAHEFVIALPIGEGEAEMAGIKRRLGIDLRRREVADHLVPEEVKGHAVVVTTSDARADGLFVETRRLVDVAARDGQVEDPRHYRDSIAKNVSERMPRRSVSRAMTSVKAMLPRFTFAPRRFTK